MLGYQLKITIKNSHPPIWRRVIVPGRITFFDLDDIIEALFGWTHSHMFAFYFRDYDMEFTGAPIKDDESNAYECIDDWMEEGERFSYTYDFGDDWEHIVEVEKIFDYDERYPKVIKSKGSNMIEDCGGLWGFYEIANEADSFDIKKMNEEFETWNLPEADEDNILMDDMLMGDLSMDVELPEKWSSLMDDMMDDIMNDNLVPVLERMKMLEDEIREQLPVSESLEDVFYKYKKDELKELAKIIGLVGYSRWNKRELAQHIKNSLLSDDVMKRVFRKSTENEIRTFWNAIEKNGAIVPENVVVDSALLINYGEYNEEHWFYQVPIDVREKCREIFTPEFQQELNEKYDFVKCFDAAIYLYGVISIEKFTEIYNHYEQKDMTKSQIKEWINKYIEEAPYIIKGDLMMDEELVERDLYKEAMKRQEKYTYYIPEDIEEFLGYGMYQCQEPDENLEFLIPYFQEKYHKTEADAVRIFFMLQDGIRMNATDEELVAALMEMGCEISSQKKAREVLNHIHKMRKYTRVWDFKGHTWQEVQGETNKRGAGFGGENNKIIPFPSNPSKKLYPNDPCPCGSGKKYKHCCGRNKKK